MQAGPFDIHPFFHLFVVVSLLVVAIIACAVSANYRSDPAASTFGHGAATERTVLGTELLLFSDLSLDIRAPAIEGQRRGRGDLSAFDPSIHQSDHHIVIALQLAALGSLAGGD